MKTALVTGANRGIGYAIAKGLRADHRVIIGARDPKAGRAAAQELDCDWVHLDLEDPDTFAPALTKADGVDVLINNAAVFASLPQRPFDEIPFDEWNLVMQVNITGSYLCASAVAPAMRAAKQGRIINVSSGTVPQGVPGFMHYVTSKSAIIGMTRVLARELSDDNINVNTLMPGYTTTEVDHASMDDNLHEFIQSKRLVKRAGTPEDLIGTALFLASPASSFISGQTIAVCGGEVMI